MEKSDYDIVKDKILFKQIYKRVFIEYITQVAKAGILYSGKALEERQEQMRKKVLEEYKKAIAENKEN